MKLKRIRRAILEDGIESNLDEALGRVLDFYRKFVPCNKYEAARPRSLRDPFFHSKAESHRQS